MQKNSKQSKRDENAMNQNELEILINEQFIP